MWRVSAELLLAGRLPYTGQGLRGSCPWWDFSSLNSLVEGAVLNLLESLTEQQFSSQLVTMDNGGYNGEGR